MSHSASWAAWATPEEAVREWARVPESRPSSRYLHTHQSPSKGQGEATTGPEANKTLMAFDSNFSSVHSPQGPAMYCAHKSCWMVSLCSGSMFVHVRVREVRKQDGGAGDREALPIVRRSWQLGQKVWRPSLSYSISWGKMPSHIWKIMSWHKAKS